MKTFAAALLLTLTFNAAAQDEPYAALIGEDGVQRVEITGGSYFFEPSHITVRLNMPVELRVRKEDLIVPHNLTLRAPEAGIDVQESLGRDVITVMFTPLKTGKFEFYCDKKLLFFESHREKGMRGILEVVE